MATHTRKPNIVAIVGPTASGKSKLAMRVALKYGGEIIAADSRTVYRGLDIGTAKPTKKEQQAVKHWGIDLVDPGQRFTAADFKEYAKAKAEDINRRGKIVVVVGGTGLYVDGLLYDFEFGPDADPAARADLETLSTEQLKALLIERGLSLPHNELNRRHLIRSLERSGGEQKHKNLRLGTVLVGLALPAEELKLRISTRARKIFDQGVLDEAAHLKAKFPDVNPSEMGIVYKLCSDVLAGILTREEAIERFVTLDRQYAKRQKTWLKRNPDIHWFESIDTAGKHIDSMLNT